MPCSTSQERVPRSSCAGSDAGRADHAGGENVVRGSRTSRSHGWYNRGDERGERGMPVAELDGLEIAYELVGEGQPWVLTPGGRFTKEVGGLADMARALA